MAKKVKNYYVDADTSGVYAVSVVSEPAIESGFVALGKQKPAYIALKSEEKEEESPLYMIYGSVLRPDFPIYRYDEWTGEEFYITFSKAAIRKLSQKYLQNYSQAEWTKEHQTYQQGLITTESWIKCDAVHDKSVAIGLDDDTVPVGSWIIGCKCDSIEVWNDIKDGKLTGFSVEAFVDLNDEELSKIKNNTDMAKDKKANLLDEIVDKVKEILKPIVGEDVEDEKVEEVAEEVTDKVKEEVESTEEDTKEDESMAKQEGESEETQEDTEDKSEKTPEEVAADVVEEIEKGAEDAEEEKNDLQTVVDELQKQLDELKKENDKLKKENQKMSKQPSTKPVKAEAQNGEKVDFSKLQAMWERR